MTKRAFLFLFVFMLFSTVVFAQNIDANEGLTAAFGTLSTTLTGFIDAVKTPEMLVVVARIFAFVIIIAVTSSVGGWTAGKTRSEGMQNASRVFGFVVALAAQLLAPEGYLLAFMFFAGALGQVILFLAALFFVRQMMKGEGEDDKLQKAFRGIIMIILGIFFLSLSFFGYENIVNVIEQGGYIMPADITSAISSIGGFLTLINVAPIAIGGWELIGALGGGAALGGIFGGAAGYYAGVGRGGASQAAQAVDTQIRDTNKQHNAKKDRLTQSVHKSKDEPDDEAARKATIDIQADLEQSRAKLNKLAQNQGAAGSQLARKDFE